MPVLAALAHRDIPTLHLDAAFLEGSDYALDGDHLVVADGDHHVVLERAAARGWVRRLAPPDWRRDAAPASHAGAVRGAWAALLVAIVRSLGVTWLSDLEQLFIAENKVVQQAAARALGIAVPRSVVTSSRERIPPDLGERLVVKPLGPGQFVGAEGQAQVLYTHDLPRDAAELDALAGAPFLVQECLRGDAHLRVVTVGSRAWVCALAAADLPLDWRRVDEAHDAFSVSEGHPRVADEARRLAAHLRVGYSSQDWLIVAGEPYFLDLNPAGQWLFLPESVASAVTAEIATWLEGEGDATTSW